MIEVTAELTRSKRLTDAQVHAIMDRLDQQETPSARNRRADPRLRYRKTGVRAEVTHPGGGVAVREVSTWNLSATGAAFLHWGFLHIGTKVVLTLKRRLGSDDRVTGVVVWCRHLGGSYHTVGVRFTARTFPQLYLDPGDWSDLPEPGADPAALTGRVLVVDDQEMDRLLLAHYFTTTAVTLESADTGDAAVAAVRAGPAFDLVLCDLNLGDTLGEQAMARMRQAGHAGPFVVTTAETDPRRLAAAEAEGAVAIVHKPLDPQKVLRVAGSYLQAGTHAAGDDVVYSDLAGTANMVDLIEQFVRKAHAMAADLRRAIDAGLLGPARTICQALRGTGTGYGFPVLTEAAKDAVTSLDASMSIEESQTQLERLTAICRRLRAGKPPR